MRPDADFRDGLTLFNAGQFFDAHEALEDIWREAPRESRVRRHLQGLVQLAVAFHHQSTRNLVGARSVLRRALKNLEGAEESFPELDWAKLGLSLEAWREYLEHSGDAPDGRGARRSIARKLPPLPTITFRSERRR